jgi:hypothetical protein
MLPALRRRAPSFRDDAFVVPARQALVMLWRNARLCMGCAGLILIVFAVAMLAAGDAAAHYSASLFAADLSMGVGWVVACVMYSTRRCRKFMAFLTYVQNRGESQSAATVAALLGGSKPAASLDTARGKFHTILHAELSRSDFAQNVEVQRNLLFGKTKKTRLGDCDAFLSHSWSDDGATKWDALSSWANAFRERQGREPKLWLDKVRSRRRARWMPACPAQAVVHS